MTECTGEDRRKNVDMWLKLVRFTTLIAWVIFTIALILSYYAAPENDYGVLRYHQIEIRKFWLSPLTGYLYILLWVSALLSYITLIIHKYRSRRASDNSRFNVQLLLLITVAWVIYLVIQLSKV